VDADRRAQALDEVDVGLVHLPEELAGVGREGLDVAALALGEDRVERQARLARPGQPREDDERVTWEVEGDVLEVVLPGAPDDELVGHSGPRSGIDGVEHMFGPERRRWQVDAPVNALTRHRQRAYRPPGRVDREVSVEVARWAGDRRPETRPGHHRPSRSSA